MAAAVSKDWACLPRDIVDLILDKVKVEFHDFIRFASVCKPWRSTALATDSHRHAQSKLRFNLLKICRNVFPRPMISTNVDCGDHRSLYSVTDEQRDHDRLQLPISCTKRLVGSSNGWLFLLDDSKILTLINPFLNKRVVLPKFQLLEYNHCDIDVEYLVRKAILVFDQERHKYGVLVIYSDEGLGRLAYLKPETEAWETITAGCSQTFVDIICYKGGTYAVTNYDSLVRVDVTKGRCRTVVKGRRCGYYAPTNYLVESQEGDLLLVQRHMDTLEVVGCDEIKVGRPCLLDMDERFGVYKLSEQAGSRLGWVEINSIGEQALYLGDNYSLSISTRDLHGGPDSRSISFTLNAFNLGCVYI